MAATSRIWVAFMVGLLSLGGVPNATATGAGLEWWGPTEIGQGFHLRIPVTVINPNNVVRTNAPALLQVDLGQALRDAGWVTAPSGDRDILQAFRLATASVRVVAMTNLNPPQPGTVDGRLRLVNPDAPAGHLSRFEVPSMVLTGFLDRPQEAAYDAQTNPIITVVWEVTGRLQPLEKRFFMIYFDSTTNADHPIPNYAGSIGWGHLQGLYWSGAGYEVLGTARGSASNINTITVVGVHPGTTIHAYGAAPGGSWRLLTPPQGFPSNPLTLGMEETADIFAGMGSSNLVRITADKPIMAYGVGTGFVPSTDIGMAGYSFLFAKTKANDDTIHFINAGDKETQITVQQVTGGGPSLSFGMSSDAMPVPYTIGARGGAWNGPGSGCTLTNPNVPSPLLPGPGLYRATVTAGGPVLLQHGLNYGLFQAVSRQGMPMGNELWSAAGWTGRAFFQPPAGASVCRNTDQTGGWFAASFNGQATARVNSLESPLQVDPPGNAGLPSPNPRQVLEAPRVVGRFPAPMLDRPLRFSSGGEDIAAFVGIHPVPGVTSKIPQVHGPLGGADGGRRFIGLGPTVVFAPYPNTEITARVDASTSGVVTQKIQMVANSTYLIDDLSSNDWIYGVQLESNRPIMAYPKGIAPGTLASLPTFLKAEAGNAEFRGFLVSLASESGLDPVTGSTTLGAPITYKLLVKNIGRQAGGTNVIDTIELSVPPGTNGWTATLDRNQITLNSGETQQVLLTVTPDASVPSGSLGVFPVTATSRGGANLGMAIRDTIGTVTYVQRSFDVGLWFDVLGQPKSQTLTSDAGKATDFAMVVKNKGSVKDVVELETTPPAEGWKLLLLHSGKQADWIALDPGQEEKLLLRITPPEGVNDGLLTTLVTAKSQSSTSVLDRVVATTKLRAPSLLSLEAEESNLHLFPGQSANFSLVLKNRGKGSAEVDLDAALDKLPGWAGSSPFIETPSGAVVNLTRISVAPGETFTFKIRVDAPPHASAGQGIGLQLNARNRETTESVAEILHAFVRPLHRVAVSLPELPIRPSFEANTTTVRVRMNNLGNLNEQLSWRVENLPSGWGMEAPSDLLLLRNATQQFDVLLKIPAGQAVGNYNVTGAWISQDGNRTVLRLPVAIGLVSSAGTSDGASGVRAQPGRSARIEVPVRNEGNVPFTVAVESLAGEPWQLDTRGAVSLKLQPGANQTMAVAWRVPESAPDGSSTHGARLVFTPQSGSVFVRELQATFDVGRADLVPVDFHAYSGPAGTLIEGRIANVGQRSAHEFVVRLMAGSEAVEEVLFQELQPGANATVRLLLPQGKATAPAVVLDAANTVMESDESNNAVSLEVERSRVGAPTFGVAGLLLVVAATLLVTQRRRWV